MPELASGFGFVPEAPAAPAEYGFSADPGGGGAPPASPDFGFQAEGLPFETSNEGAKSKVEGDQHYAPEGRAFAPGQEWLHQMGRGASETIFGGWEGIARGAQGIVQPENPWLDQPVGNIEARSRAIDQEEAQLQAMENDPERTVDVGGRMYRLRAEREQLEEAKRIGLGQQAPGARQTAAGYLGAAADAYGGTREDVRAALPVSREFDQSLGGQIVKGLGQLPANVATYLVPGLGPVSSIGQIYDEGYQDALARTGDPRAAHRAALKYVPAAALDYVGDKFVVGKLLKPLKGKVTVGAVARSLAEGAAVEGLTEGAQQGWLNVVAQTLEGYDPNRKLDDEVLDSIIVGAVVGSVGAGGGTALRGAAQRGQPAEFGFEPEGGTEEISYGAEATAPAEDPLAKPVGAPAGEAAPAEAAPVQAPAPAPSTTPLSDDEREAMAHGFGFARGLLPFAERTDLETIAAASPGQPRINALQSAEAAATRRRQVSELVPLGYSPEEAAAMTARQAFTILQNAESPEVIAQTEGIAADNMPFSVGEQTAGARGISPADATAAVASLFGGVVPQNVRIYSTPRQQHVSGAIVQGFAAQGQVWINAGNVRDAMHAQQVLLEEGWHLVENDPALAEARARLEEQLTPEQLVQMAELGYGAEHLPSEALARELQRIFASDQQRTLWQRVIDALKAAYGRLFGRTAVDDDGRRLIRAALEGIADPRNLAERFSMSRKETVQEEWDRLQRERQSPDRSAEIVRAYDSLRKEAGFSHILISDLQKRSGVPLPELQEWLRQGSREGTAVLARGDWSLSDQDARAASIEIGGEAHLRVALQPEARFSLAPSQEEAESAATDPGKRRKFIDSVKAQEAVAPSVRDRIESIYQPITNAATVAAAKARIDEIGIDRALAEVMSTSPANPPTALTNTTGIELIGRLQAIGRFDDEAAIAEHLAQQATTQGQAIQSLSLIARLSPGGIDLYAQRLIQRAVRSGDSEMQKLHAEIQRLKEELRKLRRNQATQAIMDIAEAIRAAGLTPEKQVELQQKLRDALILGATEPGTALARLKQILRSAGLSDEQASRMAKKALESFLRAQKAARDRVLRQMLSNRKNISARIPKSELEKWLEMNRSGILDDETLYAGIARRWGIPQFTRAHAAKIKALQRAYEAAPPGDLKLAAAARMLEAVHELVPVDFWTKVRAVRNLAMLLNPKTIIRNVGGNVVLWLAEVPADTVSWTIDAATSVVTGARTRTGLQMAERLRGLAAPIRDYRAGVQYARDQGRAHGLWRAGIEHMLTMSRLTSGGVFHEGGINERYRTIFSGRVMKGLENLLALGLGVGDRAFHQSAFLASLARQRAAVPGAELSPTPQMIETALMDANTAIFQDENVVSKALGAMQRTLNLNSWGRDERRFGLGNVIVPFTQVPGSIVARAAGTWSPIGFIRGIYSGRHLLYRRGEFDQRAFTDLLSRGALGSGLGYLGYYLFRLGILSALPEDDPDREAMRKAAGLGQYRVNVSEMLRRMTGGDWHTPASQTEAAQDGDVVRNYDWMQPLAVPVAAGAQIGAQEGGRARALASGKNVSDLAAPFVAIGAGLQTLEAQPLVSSFSRFMREAGRESTAENPLGGVSGAVLQAATSELISGFVPTAVRQMTALSDNAVRENRADRIRGIASDLPGMSAQFPPRYDVLGEMQERYQYGTNTIVNVLLNPAFSSRVKSDPVLQELDSLYERTGEAGVLLRQAGRTVQINGRALELTNEQRSEYQRFIGQVGSSMVRELIAAPAYASLPDDTKARLVSSALAGAGSAGKLVQLGSRLKERPDQWTVRALVHARALGYALPQ